MKGYRKPKKLIALGLFMVFTLLPLTAFAAVDVSAKADQTEVKAGDTVEVVITVKGSGMSVAEGLFTYDPALLTFESGEGGASDGFLNMVSAAKGGADTLSARIRFVAATGGSAVIEASIDKVTGYDGKAQDGAKASVTIAITAAPETPPPAQIDYAAKGVLAQSVKDATEELYIWRTLENVTIPSRYAQTTLSYHGETVAAAKVEDSDAPTLLYLSNATGETGGYYIYDEAADTLYPYKTVNSVSKSYILLEPDGSIAAPEGFAATTIVIDEKEYPAFKSGDAQGELYLLYVRNPDGETGYYLYNPDDQSLQRYAVMPARPNMPSYTPGNAEAAATPDQSGEIPAAEEKEGVTIGSVAFYLMIAAMVLLALAVAGLIVLRHVERERRRKRAAQRRAEREKEYNESIGM
ncbi:cohesin domain-containing protein [Christensenellaceae bacterium OttesenSCG-928-M15]|nr:cohesin domain-containing protein [Christensenellaceae bacterium OttesenSCG-928-M15]